MTRTLIGLTLILAAVFGVIALLPQIVLFLMFYGWSKDLMSAADKYFAPAPPEIASPALAVTRRTSSQAMPALSQH